jgi:dihydrofolate synthase / folylpolyglutamate synthase
METLKNTAPLAQALLEKSVSTSLLSELFTRCESKINYSLGRIERFHQAFSCPQSAYRTIHVAGTNGKGSVSFKIAYALEKEGYKVGLFTSPHLFDATERVRINQKNISPQDFTLLYQEISEKEKVLGEKLTFFEVLTLMAFIYFQREKVDFAVIEAGLGGRLDATNILTPYAVVITSIALDHMEYLGTSLEDIAREKAAIIKDCDKVVIGANTPGLVVQEPWIKVRGSFKNFDEENQKAAEEALLLMGIKQHYKEARLPCRMEVQLA